MAKVIQFIYTEDHRGVGTKDDPMRIVPQLWTLDGELVAEDDTNGSGDRFFYAYKLNSFI